MRHISRPQHLCCPRDWSDYFTESFYLSVRLPGLPVLLLLLSIFIVVVVALLKLDNMAMAIALQVLALLFLQLL